VLDGETNLVLPYCYVTTEIMKSGEVSLFTTDENGEAEVEFPGKMAVNINFLGYRSLSDTIHDFTGQKTYQLLSDPYNLEQVVITGQNKPVSIDNSIYSIKLIGKRTIEQKASNNLAELLDDELNIQINNDPSLGSSVKLQGIAGENVKILIDGVPVIGRLDGNIDLSQINLNEVDHVEIVEGPMSVIYGSNALAGVINIITKENRRSKLMTGLESYYESVGVYNINGNVNFNTGSHGLGFNFGRNFFGGYSLDPNSRSKQWKPKEQYNGRAQYIFTKNKIKTKFKSDVFRERLLDRNNPSAPYFDKGNDTWFHTFRLNNSLHNNLRIDASSNVNLLLSYSYYNREKIRYLKDLTTLERLLSPNPGDHDTTAFNAFIVRGSYNYDHPKNKISIQTGLDLNHETAFGKRILNTRENMGDYAVFLSAKWKVNEVFTLQPSVRASYNTKYDAPLTPSLNLKYARQDHSLRLSYARGFRAPSLKELYLYFYDSNHQIEGNEDLKAENSHNLNLVVDTKYRMLGRDIAWQISGFYNKIFDKITLVNIDAENSLHYRNENVGEFQSVGGSIKFEFKPIDKIDVGLGFSEIGRKDNLYEDEPFIFTTNGNANLSLKMLNNTATLSLFYKYLGPYPYYIYNENDQIDISYIDDYHNMDITLNKKFFNYKLSVSTGVKNLFNNIAIAGSGGQQGTAHSDASSSLVGWGRSYFVSLKYNFQTD